MTTESSPAALLDELAALRSRARRQRHGYWFPLLLFGVLTLIAVPFYEPVPRSDHVEGRPLSDTSFEVPLLGPVNPLGVVNSNMINIVKHPLALGLYWVFALVVGLVATVWWYRWRAERAGLATETSTYVRTTVAGLAVLIGIPVGNALLPDAIRLRTYGLLIGSVVFLFAGVLSAVTLKAASSSRWRWPLLVGAFLLLSVLGALSVRKTGGLLLFAIGLLVLAWVERSVLCAAVATVFTGFVLGANISVMGQLFYYLGWNFGGFDSTWFAAKDLLLPAAVLLVGGVVALLAGRRAVR
jgi:hypothetical protein